MQEKYLQLKKENEERDEHERQEPKGVHEMLYSLYLLKYIKAERTRIEPAPDRPGYSILTKWHEPFDWPSEFGPRPTVGP
jgi:hypothetical protein